jgi:hypothetical protein
MSVVNAIRCADTIGQNLGSLIGSEYWQNRLIASYTTRTYAATAAQRARIKHFVGIDQAPTGQLAGAAKVKDVEPGAALLGNAVSLAAAGHKFVCYTFEANMGAARAALSRFGIPFWVADWNLNEAGALAYLAAHRDVVGVQWCSPTSNPGIVVPGANGHTVRQLNVDLSVMRKDFWLPAPPAPKPVVNPHGVWKFQGSWDADRNHWTVKPRRGSKVKMGGHNVSHAAQISVGEKKGDWSIHRA